MHMRLSIVALVALVAACAAPAPKPASDNVLGKDFSAPPANSLVVLLPLIQAREFEAGENFLAVQLNRQLQAAGCRVATLSRANYELVWGQEVAAVGGIFDPASGAPRPQAYANAVSQLAQRVCVELKCALLIQPRMVRRTATFEALLRR